MQTDLSHFSNKWYRPGSALKRIAWYYCNTIIFKTGLFPFSGFKIFLLRSFGSKIGSGVLIKPYVNIKYPWFLSIGNHTWIGEHVWIDNLAPVDIGSNVCISQGAFLLTGNHDFTKKSFDLMIKGISIEDGVWIGAKSIICPGVRCKNHSVLSVGSVAVSDLEPYSIYKGSFAVKVKERIINE
ncbi:putative colanic acid biosynthesis acetyltransferase [soil metagenome]